MVKIMYYTELEEVRVRTWNGAIGTVERVVFKRKYGKETDIVDHYEMEIDGTHGVVVYPDEIDE